MECLITDLERKTHIYTAKFYNAEHIFKEKNYTLI